RFLFLDHGLASRALRFRLAIRRRYPRSPVQEVPQDADFAGGDLPLGAELSDGLALFSCGLELRAMADDLRAHRHLKLLHDRRRLPEASLPAGLVDVVDDERLSRPGKLLRSAGVNEAAWRAMVQALRS